MTRYSLFCLLGLATTAFSSVSLSAGEQHQTTIALPSTLPQQFSTAVRFANNNWTINLEKHAVFGENTRFLVQRPMPNGGDARLVEVAAGADRAYLGTVVGLTDHVVSAQLTDCGLIATVFRPGQPAVRIEPVDCSATLGVHRVFVDEPPTPPSVVIDDPAEAKVGDPLTAALTLQGAAQREEPSSLATAGETDEQVATGKPPRRSRRSKSSMPTKRPTRIMDVLEFEVGVEIGSRAFLAKGAYNGDLDKAKAIAASVAANLDARYLRGAGIKHTIGTVIIRTDAADDPLRDRVTATGAGGNAGRSLAAFRDYWNSHPEEVGTTHDLAVYHVYHAPSGLAYVNSAGSPLRYATTGGRGATSWADGTVTHEFGHSWNLKHVGQSGLFYESKPRNAKGSHTAGGKPYFVSVMHGDGRHNIGRLATDEANVVIASRDSKRRFGKRYQPGPTAPFGHRDAATVEDKPVVIDVVANDHDVNNDVLDARVLDTVSHRGGTISLSPGTGPGGRSEIVYTPPRDGLFGVDFFHYTVFDTTGRTDWGAVYVTSNSLRVTEDRKSFNYDPGPANSQVFNSKNVQAVLLTPETRGDVFWSRRVNAADRPRSRKNAYNRDFIFGTKPATLTHKLANGRWRVMVNMSDPAQDLDNMYVKAEGKPQLTDLDRPAGENETVSFEVDVRDGKLNLTFGDADRRKPLWALNRVVLQRVE